MSNLVKYGSRALGIGVGFAVAGPLGAGVGSCLGDFAHDFLGDAFGSEKDLGSSYGGLLGNLFAGGIQTLFSQPQDYPDFNHHFRRGLLDALVITLRERATDAYRSTYHHGPTFCDPLNTRFHAAAAHLQAAAKAALKARSTTRFDALFPAGSTDDLLLQLPETDAAIDHSRHSLLGQWYDQVLAPAILKAQEKPPFTDDATFRERALTVIAAQLPAVFATELKKNGNDALRIALERLSFQSLRAALRDIQRHLPGTLPHAQGVDEKLGTKIDDLSRDMHEALRYLRAISADVTSIKKGQLSQSEREARMESEMQTLRGTVSNMEGTLLAMHDMLKSMLVLQSAPDIETALKRAMDAGTLIPGMSRTAAADEFGAIIAWVDASAEVPPLYKGIAAHLTGRYEEAAEFASDAIFEEKQTAEPRSWYLIRAALLEADALVAAKKHTEAALALEETADLLDPATQPLLLAHILRHSGNLYREAGRPADAVLALQDSLSLYSRHLGVTDPTLAGVANELGLAQNYNAQFREAETNLRFALASWELHDGPTSVSVRAALNNLAALLQATNRLAEAEPLMRRALRIDETCNGPDHPNVSIDLNYLAGLLLHKNRLAEAEPLMRRALRIDEASYGPDHPNVATSLSFLAQLLQDKNRLAEAEPLMRRALEIDEACFGKDHPTVARDLSNLAVLLKATNRLAEAELLTRRALRIDEVSYGPEHPMVAIRLHNLGSLLLATDRLAEAEPLMRRALVINEASYGPDHPSVAGNLNNLARLLHETNRLAEAEPLMRRASSIDEASYGPDHPRVATDLNNIAGLLQDTDRPAEAEPLLRRALAISVASLGAEHPSSKRYQKNVDALLAAQSQPPET